MRVVSRFIGGEIAHEDKLIAEDNPAATKLMRLMVETYGESDTALSAEGRRYLRSVWRPRKIEDMI